MARTTLAPADLSGDDNKLKKPTGHANLIASRKGIELLYSHYSSWDSLRKAIAWMARFKKYMLSRSSKAQDHVPRGPLTVPEVNDTEKDIISRSERILPEGDRWA